MTRDSPNLYDHDEKLIHTDDIVLNCAKAGTSDDQVSGDSEDGRDLISRTAA